MRTGMWVLGVAAALAVAGTEWGSTARAQGPVAGTVSVTTTRVGVGTADLQAGCHRGGWGGGWGYYPPPYYPPVPPPPPPVYPPYGGWNPAPYGGGYGYGYGFGRGYGYGFGYDRYRYRRW